MLQQDGTVDEDEESESEEEEEFTGTWDDNCKLVAYDMQTKKALADQFASERIAELIKKNSKCRLHINTRFAYFRYGYYHIPDMPYEYCATCLPIDLHAMAPTGKQFIHWAAYGGCVLTCKVCSDPLHFLLQSSPGKVNHSGFSTCTQSSVFFSPVQLLLSRGAKKDAEDIWKKTAFDYAVQSGQPESILAILRPK